MKFSISTEYPPIKHPKNGIFKWFHSLSNAKKSFHNQTLFGFRVNSTDLDLSMITKDIANHLNLHNLNLSGKLADIINNYQIPSINYSKKLLLGRENCPKEYKNIHQFCLLTGINPNLENIGIPPEHVDIILSNIIGYFPCGLFLIILGIATIVFYIVQIILSFFFFKPVENTSPTILQFFLFYFGEAIVLTSAILYFFSYDGISQLFLTINSIDSVIGDITSSLSSSLHDITKYGIPNAVGPIITNIESICNKTNNYLSDTSSNFLDPTILILQKLVSKNESDLGVFTIYNSHIFNLAKDFYKCAKKYPKLNNISKYFAKYDFTSFQNEIQNLLDKELEFADKMKALNSFFDYLNSTIHPYHQYVSNLTHQTIKGTNKTVGQFINDFKYKKFNSFDKLSQKLNLKANESENYNKFIKIAFFVFGFFLIFSVFFYSFIYIFHNKFSICIASTVSIYAIIMTILMFFIAFVFTEFGSADVSLSKQLEPAIDQFLTNIIDNIIPFRTIEFPLINITHQTNNFYKGEIKLSNIVFPSPMNNFEYFVYSDKTTGLADSLQLISIADLSKYGDELGDFIIKLGQDFILPLIIVKIIDNVSKLFRLVSYFPKKIDGFFNWGIPITLTTKHLRLGINLMDKKALPELDVYLKEIDNYVDLMNSQYQIALHAIFEDLANALDNIDEKLLKFIRSVMNDLGVSVKHLLKNVYPILNYIEIEPLIGPYAMVRNIVFYDLASTSAYISISGTLLMIGLVFIVVFMWIRRKGMLTEDSLELRRNISQKLDSADSTYEKIVV